ncbi:MAG: Do family serine endopeptidase [Alphaproteobacteria bacterium]|nr:Do family serine endopeptidase [Alphaproteobacteria bacterium]
MTARVNGLSSVGGVGVALLLGLAIGLLGGATASRAQQVPDSDGQIKLTFAPIVKKTAPAVVNIYTKKVVRQRGNRLFDDPFFRRFFGDSLPFNSGPRERVENSLGSGVIVDDDGIVITNHHVIDGADEIRVVLTDKREFQAAVLLSDQRTDIAILQMQELKRDLPTIPFGDSEDIEVGDLVIAIGNPFGLGQTVTSGIVSGLARTSVGITDFRSFIQTDAAINPGNSGGALIDTNGRLIGINTAIFSKSGGSQGIGFAVPISMVRRILSSAVAGEPLVRPWLGFSGRDVDAEIAEALGLELPGGVIVEEVHPESPASAAGLERGDVIISVAGRQVDDGQSLRFYFATRELGGEVELGYLRGESFQESRFALLAPPETPPRDRTDIAGDFPISGLRVVNLSPRVAEEMGISTDMTGVIVEGVRRGSVAAQAGIRRMDIITTVNGRDITLVSDLVAITRSPPGQWLVELNRQGRRLVLEVR